MSMHLCKHYARRTILNSRKGQRTNQKYRNLVCCDQQMQKLEQTELGKADRTVGVNCYDIFSNISSGMA